MARTIKRFRFSLLSLCILVAFVGAIFACGFGVSSLFNPFNDKLFDRVIWLESKASERARMADNLIKTELRPGKRKAWVHELLGQPFHDRKLGDGRSLLTYHIGTWPIRGYDDTFVYIYFDANDRLLRSEISGH